MDIGGAFYKFKDDAEIWDNVGGASPEDETPEAMNTASPSANVVERILNSVEFTIQDQRLRRAVWGTLTGIYSVGLDAGKRKVFTLSGPPASGADSPVTGNFETWELSGFTEILRAPHDDRIENLSFEPGAALINTISGYFSDSKLHHWKIADGTENAVPSPLPGYLGEQTVKASDDGRFVITSADEKWSIWDTRTGQKAVLPDETEFEDLGPPILDPLGTAMIRTAKKPGAAGEWILTYRLTGNAYERAGSWLKPANTSAQVIRSGPNYVLLGEEKKPLQVREFENGRDITPGDVKALGEASMVKISRDGYNVAIVAPDKNKGLSFYILDMLRGQLMETGMSWNETITGFEISPHGKYLAMKSWDNNMMVMDIPRKKVLLIDRNREIARVAISDDERYLASGDSKGFIKVTDLNTLEDIAHLFGNGIVTGLIFSENGRYIAASTALADDDYGDGDGNVLHVWSVQSSDLLNETCRRLRRFGKERDTYCKN